MLLLLLGAMVGLTFGYGLYWRARREAARLAEEKQAWLEERKSVLAFMHEMVDAVGERLPREELFQRIVHASILSTGALSARIFEMTEDGMLRGVAVEGLFPPHRPIPESEGAAASSRSRFIERVLKAETFSPGEGIVGRVAATGRGELIADAAADGRIARHDDPALTVRSMIAAPIVVRRRPIGVLCVCNPSDGLPFTETDYSLVEALAEQAGLAVHNADFVRLQVEKRQHDLDLELASDVQQMLLPRRMPAVRGFDIDARYQPAQMVSGDFYDVFALGDSRLGVVVADVAGKGVAGSLLMAICRTCLRLVAARHESPARVLGALNRILAGDIREGMFITLTYAVLDATAGTATFARAGHELPLFGRPGTPPGTCLTEFAGSEGMAIGMAPPDLFDEAIADCTRPFGPGETLVLYTDGITEAPNAREEEFGGDRLAVALKEFHARSAREIGDGVLDAVRRFAGEGTRRDDCTLVTVRRA